MPDTITQVSAIFARTLRELEQAIDNPSVTSALRGLGSLFGLDDDGATARGPSRPREAKRRRSPSASRPPARPPPVPPA